MLTSLPDELLSQILSWIEPPHTQRLSSISTQFRSVTSSVSFAKTNLLRFHPLPPSTSNASHAKVNEAPSALDLSIFKAQSNYQSAYTQLYLTQYSSLYWSYKEQINGSRIPDSLGLLSSSLVHLNLTFCGLVGEIPISLMDLVKLNTLSLYGNALCGRIPSKIKQLSRLKTLILYGNRLSGPIPPELGLLLNLRFVNLSQNQLSGTVPKEIGNLFMIEEFHVRQNCLSGMVPEEIRKLENAYLLDFRFNEGLNVGFEFPSLVK
ncbi:hypothetical protein BDR26DRAFT_875185 [Obelidium mucronatum]|nr:hypothetical protein BDR26DRAFT_875185 [Obelidium mucronatum]